MTEVSKVRGLRARNLAKADASAIGGRGRVGARLWTGLWLALVAALVLSCNNPFLDSLLGSPLGAAASGLNIAFSGGEPGMTYYIEVYDTSEDEITSLEDIYDYEYPLIAAGELIDGAGTLPDAPTLTGEYYVVIDDEDYLETLGGLVYFDNGNANFDLSALLLLN